MTLFDAQLNDQRSASQYGIFAVQSGEIEDQRRFVERLLDPPEPTPALARAWAAHGTLIGLELIAPIEPFRKFLG